MTDASITERTWDDELEQLAEHVRLVFGEGAVFEATVRAVQLTPSVIVEDDELALVPPEDVLWRLDAVNVADAVRLLKAELRRLLTAH
jgi:hypothetical protein